MSLTERRFYGTIELNASAQFGFKPRGGIPIVFIQTESLLTVQLVELSISGE